MADPVPCFRNASEETAFEAVKAEIEARIPRRPYVAESDSAEWWQNMFPWADGWVRRREAMAALAFRKPIDPEVAVIADALIRAGHITDDLYARLLNAADRQQARYPQLPAEPVTRAVAFDAFGTLVRIGRKRRPYERLIARAREKAARMPSPMSAPIALVDYAALLGLPEPHAELERLEEELTSIELYPDALDCLARIRERGMTVAVASNLAEPYAGPLRALLGDLVDVWHLSFTVGATKPLRGFYATLTDRLGIEANELLMVGDTWKDDVAGAVDAGARARWLDREGRGGYARRFVAVRTLDDIGWDLRSPVSPTRAPMHYSDTDSR